MENKGMPKLLFAHLIRGSMYRLLYMALLFAIGLVIAAISGATIFGTIALMIANAAILQIITGLGTDSALVWHGSGGGFQKEKLFSFAFLTGVLQVVLFIALFYVVYQVTGNHLLSWQPGHELFGYELLYFSSIVIVEKYSSVLYARQRASDCNRVLAISAFVVFIFLGIMYGGAIQVKIDMITLYSCISFFPALMLMLYYHWGHGKLFASFTRKDVISFYHFSIIVFITNLIQFVAYRADFWIIEYFQDTTQVGIYAQSNRFAQLLWVIPNILAGILAPVLATGIFDKMRLVILTRLISYFNLILAAIIVLVSLFFYRYFLGKEFGEGFRALLIMLPGFYFFCLNILFAAWFSAKRMLWVNFAGSLLCLLLVLIFDWILIPQLGINGAAIASTIAYSIAGFFHVIMFARITKMGVGEFFRFNKKDWRSILNLQP
jgi:O-antigen/teichoic acid export membrane protein